MMQVFFFFEYIYFLLHVVHVLPVDLQNMFIQCVCTGKNYEVNK